MDELVDILDKDGNYTGETVLKSKVHKLGLFHPTVHVWCYSRFGWVLLQQRGAHKRTYPLKWDVSVAGHVGAGESPEQSALREVEEEIGVSITIEQLEKMAVLMIEKKHTTKIWDREFVHVFLYQMEMHTPLTKQESEVNALEWISLQEFEKRIQNKYQGFVPQSAERHLKVLNAIQSRL